MEITRSWHLAYIALGSNLGDREKYIRQGAESLDRREDCVVQRISRLIGTEPYGVKEQPEFLNGMLELRTLLLPEELLDVLHEVEQEAHRERKMHWGPRTLDLDIIFYDDCIVDREELQIPHPDMENREFVLKPLAELAPYLRHPLNGKTVRQMLAEIRNEDDRYWRKLWMREERLISHMRRGNMESASCAVMAAAGAS